VIKIESYVVLLWRSLCSLSISIISSNISSSSSSSRKKWVVALWTL